MPGPAMSAVAIAGGLDSFSEALGSDCVDCDSSVLGLLLESLFDCGWHPTAETTIMAAKYGKEIFDIRQAPNSKKGWLLDRLADDSRWIYKVRAESKELVTMIPARTTKKRIPSRRIIE